MHVIIIELCSENSLTMLHNAAVLAQILFFRILAHRFSHNQRYSLKFYLQTLSGRYMERISLIVP